MLFKDFFSISSFDGHFVKPCRHLSNFGTESSTEHFCEIILKSTYQPWWRCRFTVFSIFSSGGHYVEQGRTIFAILEKLHQGNICIKLF